MKILILGDGNHGKDALANLICKHTNLKALSSSRAAAEIFLFDILNEKYKLNYKNIDEAHKDRREHRAIWFNEISEYNREDKTRLVKDILKKSDIYVGLREESEVQQAIKENAFDMILGVYDYRKPREPKSSNTADVFKYAEIMVLTNGTLEDLEKKVLKLLPIFK